MRENLQKLSEDGPQVNSVKRTCGRVEEPRKADWNVPLQYPCTWVQVCWDRGTGWPWVTPGLPMPLPTPRWKRTSCCWKQVYLLVFGGGWVVVLEKNQPSSPHDGMVELSNTLENEPLCSFLGVRPLPGNQHHNPPKMSCCAHFQEVHSPWQPPSPTTPENECVSSFSGGWPSLAITTPEMTFLYLIPPYNPILSHFIPPLLSLFSLSSLSLPFSSLPLPPSLSLPPLI